MSVYSCCGTCPTEPDCPVRVCVDSDNCCPHGGCEDHCDECNPPTSTTLAATLRAATQAEQAARFADKLGKAGAR